MFLGETQFELLTESVRMIRIAVNQWYAFTVIPVRENVKTLPDGFLKKSRKEDKTMAKNEKTSPRAASAAARVLRNKNSSKDEKSAAASALTQAADRKKSKK